MGRTEDKKNRSGKLSKNKSLRSPSLYRAGLVNLYSSLVKRSTSSFNEKVLRQLRYPKRMRVPVSLRKVLSIISNNPEKKHGMVYCTTSTLTADDRESFAKEHLLKGLKICAFKVSNEARKTVEEAGGEVIEWSDLVKIAPTGENCKLVLGNTGALRRYKYMGMPCGLKGSKTWERGPKKREKNY